MMEDGHGANVRANRKMSFNPLDPVTDYYSMLSRIFGVRLRADALRLGFYAMNWAMARRGFLSMSTWA